MLKREALYCPECNAAWAPFETLTVMCVALLRLDQDRCAQYTSSRRGLIVVMRIAMFELTA